MRQATSAREAECPGAAGSGASIALRYVLFAVISALVNFATQEAVLFISPVYPLMLSVLAGTATGFAVKYILDKKWIFFDRYTSSAREIRMVVLYALFSVATTLVFWSFELAFWAIWQTSFAKYSGAAFGLTIGYLAKYELDRRFVFRDGSA